MKTKRFPLIACLIPLVVAAFFPSGLVFGQEMPGPTKPYKIYQHDTLGYNYALWVPGSGSTVSVANVFRVTAQYGETLEAVSFHTLIKETKYEVSVVPNYSGPSSLENETDWVAHGTLSEPGYHTIDLESPVNLVSGAQFAVVVRQTALSRPAIASDSAKAESGKGSVSHAGESFVLLGGGWSDLYGMQPNTNVCVRAFTWDGSAPEPPKMSVADMEKELEYVLGRMRADHPAVKKNGFTATQLDVIASVRKNIAAPITKQDYYFQMQRVFAMMGESQTFLWNPLGEKLYLDLPFQWLMDDGMVVTQDAGSLLKGDQIVSIGGKSAAELAQTLWEIVSSENEYWVRFSAQSILQRESYLSYLGLLNPDATVDVEILRDGKATVYHLPLTTTRPLAQDRTVEMEWHIEKDNDLGYFRFDIWPHGDNMGPLQQELGRFFEAVRSEGVSNIVFDWRYAEGAYSWITNTLVSYIDTGRLYTENGFLGGEKKPEAELFKGTTYVLTSNETFGASVVLATLLHDNDAAVTMGEPTAERPANSRADVANEYLPVTRWTFRLATKTHGRAMNLDASEVSLFPDIPVYTSRLDLVAGKDAQMEKVREVIASQPEVVVTPIIEPREVKGYTGGDLLPYVSYFSYSERFNYFIIEFTDPIDVLYAQGIVVTDQMGESLALRNVCIAISYNDTLIVALKSPIAESDRCVVTIPAGAVSLSNGITNGGTMNLENYRYSHYNP